MKIDPVIRFGVDWVERLYWQGNGVIPSIRRVREKIQGTGDN